MSRDPEKLQMADRILKILINKRFRSGPKPDTEAGANIKKMLYRSIDENQPIHLFQFWGGCKNPNLPGQHVDDCERLTLDNLAKIALAVHEIYEPGLRIGIFPGDERVHKANLIPKQHTIDYVNGLKQLAGNHGEIFHVTPVSALYRQYAADFDDCLLTTNARISNAIYDDPNFDILLRNASKNLFGANQMSAGELLQKSAEAARTYIVYRVAEEQAGIYRDFENYIRCSFIRFSPFYHFYRQFILDIDLIQPPLKGVLHFYTGGKGNITQPWQACGISKSINNDRVVFLSQTRRNQYLPQNEDKQSALSSTKNPHQHLSDPFPIGFAQIGTRRQA